MGRFSDILLTVDFDRTLTAPNSTIPERNIEAIRYFMDCGGAFTVNTGRSLPFAAPIIKQVPVNAPMLLYNGAAAYDTEKHSFLNMHIIPQEPADLLPRIMALCPDLVTEIQGLDAHYTFAPNDGWQALYVKEGCPWGYITPEAYTDPFLKTSILGPFSGTTVESLFQQDAAKIVRYDKLEADLNREFGDTLSIVRASPQIIDLQVGGINKGTAARELAKQLGRSTLVCIGDERNDISMLNTADHAFCPADGKLADRYETVCPCGSGAVADVIFKKIPEILGICP